MRFVISSKADIWTTRFFLPFSVIDVSITLFVIPRSQIGKAILSQPACVSKLLSLLLDQRPSPKLVLIILQLCRAALPLMSVEDCENVELPPWSYSVPSLNNDQEDTSDPASKIASLLLAKLADYVVPGEYAQLYFIGMVAITGNYVCTIC